MLKGHEGCAMKACSKCGEQRSADDFYKDARKKDGLFAACKLCHAEMKRDWRSRNPDKVKSRRKRWRSSEGGMAARRRGRSAAAKRGRAELSNRYVRSLISDSIGVRAKHIPPEMVEAKRAVIAVKRLILERTK